MFRLFQETIIAVIAKEDGKKKKSNKKLPEIPQPKAAHEERLVQSEEGARKKPRMPWLKKKKKVETVGKDFFDNWITIPPEVLKTNNDATSYKTRQSAPPIFSDNFPGRDGYVGYYSAYS